MSALPGVGDGADHNNTIPAGGNNNNRDLTYYLPLYKAVLKGDLEGVRSFWIVDKDALSTTITLASETALHLTSYKGCNPQLVEELMSLMTSEALAMKDNKGNTALCLAAIAGATEVAKVMVRKHSDLTGIRNDDGYTPLLLAALYGQADTVWYLLSAVSPSHYHGQDGARLLNAAIIADMDDVALYLLDQFPKLATTQDQCGESALCLLARKNFKKRLRPLDFIYKSSIIGNIYWEKLIDIQKLKLLRCTCEQIFSRSCSEIIEFFQGSDILSDAVKFGNVEFIVECLKSYPDLKWMKSNNKNIFHIAVEHRQPKVFKLIHGLKTSKYVLASQIDESNQNNILHLAATLPASSQVLNSISNPLLQMQQELRWFKEVESLVPASYKELKNSEGITPVELFTAQHKNLIEKGEKWMKDTASSSMVVATLIATVVFAAAFTVPGGNNSDTGLPIFLDSISFKIFVISDALALFSSCSSVLIFLIILNSRFAEVDFLKILPMKFLCGVISLLLSIATMLVVVGECLFIVLGRRGRWAWFLTLFAYLCFLLVQVFAGFQLGLIYKIISNMSDWAAFRQNRRHQLY